MAFKRMSNGQPHRRNVAKRSLRPSVGDGRAGQRSVWAAAFSFLKEWGGIGTVIIAIFYTFPLDLLDRVINAQEREREAVDAALESARRSLADMAALRAEKASRLQQSTDARYQNEINGAYDIRMYNLIYTKKDEFRKFSDKLRSSELYMVGGSLSLIGEVGEAQYYYDKAIDAAIDEERSGTLITIYREKGNSLFADSPFRDVEKARKSYLTALELLAKDEYSYSVNLYVANLSELVAGEILYGDWDCGMSKKGYVNALFEMVGANNSVLNGYYQMFNSVNAPARSSAGCNYEIPIHPKLQ